MCCSTIVGNGVQSNQLPRMFISTLDIAIGSWDKFSTPNLKYAVSIAPRAKYTAKRRRFRFAAHADIALQMERQNPATAITVVMFNWSTNHFKFKSSSPFNSIITRRKGSNNEREVI